MRINPSDRKACRACQADIVFAETPRKHLGQPVVMPVDAEPDDKGNVLVSTKNGKYYAGVLGRNQAAGARDNGQQLHRSHFATCTNPERFRHFYGDSAKK